MTVNKPAANHPWRHQNIGDLRKLALRRKAEDKYRREQKLLDDITDAGNVRMRREMGLWGLQPHIGYEKLFAEAPPVSESVDLGFGCSMRRPVRYSE